MHVHPERPGRGIDGIVLETAAERAAGLGCYRIQLTSNIVRRDEHRFCEVQGVSASRWGFPRSLLA